MDGSVEGTVFTRIVICPKSTETQILNCCSFILTAMWAQVATSSPDIVSLQAHIDLAKEFDKYRTAFVIIFDLAQAACFTFLSIVFLTAYISKNVHRSAPWFMFIGSAMVWTGTYLSILGQQDGTVPPFAFCAFQASLVYACNTFVTSAALALVCDMTFKMRAAIRGRTLPGRRWNITVLTFPPLVFLGIFIWTLLIALNSPELVELDSTHMFCHISVSPSIEPPLLQPFSISAISTLIPTVFLAIFSVWNAWIIFLHRKRTGLYPSEFESAHARGFSWTPFIRRNVLMALLSLIGIVMGATAFHEFTEPNSPLWNIALVFMPFAISALMGTRMDLLMVWFPKLRKIMRKTEKKDAGHV